MECNDCDYFFNRGLVAAIITTVSTYIPITYHPICLTNQVQCLALLRRYLRIHCVNCYSTVA